MAAKDLSGKSVLVVDDARFSLQMVARQLAGENLENIYYAQNGEEGVQILASTEEPVDFVISDINMPVMNGLDFLKAVRNGSAGVTRNLPFALLTGYAEKNLVEVAMSLDVSAFLIKPVSKAALMSRIHQMFQHHERENRLKPIDRYQEVSVAAAIAESRVSYDAGTAEEAARKEAEVALKKIRADRAVARSSPLKSVAQEPDGTELVTLDTLPRNAVLAHDIRTKKGMMLAPAGTVLSDGMISLLLDARKLGHEIDVIRINPTG